MNIAEGNRRRKVLAGAALAVGGALVGAVLASSLSASATTSVASSPSASPSSCPGVQENDGIPEAREHHGGFALNLSGAVTAVGTDTVTIRTSGGATKTYKVDGNSDIDKNGEAQLSSLAVGDAVRYSVRSGTSTIDKLHAGSEAKDAPTFRPPLGNGTAA